MQSFIQKKYIISIIIFVAIFTAPLLLIGLIYGKEIEFSPADFATEWFKLFISLIPIILSFWVVTIFWANKQKRERIHQVRNFVKRFLYQIEVVAEQTERLRVIEFSELEIENSIARDIKMRGLFSRLMWLVEGLLENYPEEEIYEDRVLSITLINLIWDEIVPIIQTLSSIDEIRGEDQNIKENLDLLIQSSKTGIELIRKSTSHSG